MNKSYFNLLFIDSSQDWLNYARSVLCNYYNITTKERFDIDLNTCENSIYDVIFVASGLAHSNLEKIRALAQTGAKPCGFVILFPGLPDSQVARYYFKAKVNDVRSKPYDPKSFKEMVEQEIETVMEKRRVLQATSDENLVHSGIYFSLHQQARYLS